VLVYDLEFVSVAEDASAPPHVADLAAGNCIHCQ
jgi:hypothetical protein